MQEYDDNNIFARIIRGELPCHKVYENDHSIVFMDLLPQSPGHTLVVSKTKAVNILDISSQDLKNLMEDVQKVAVAAQDAFNADGICIFQFNGEAAGQTVFHLHFHVIPRYAHEVMQHHASKREDPGVLDEYAKRLRDVLKIS